MQIREWGSRLSISIIVYFTVYLFNGWMFNNLIINIYVILETSPLASWGFASRYNEKVTIFCKHIYTQKMQGFFGRVGGVPPPKKIA